MCPSHKHHLLLHNPKPTNLRASFSEDNLGIRVSSRFRCLLLCCFMCFWCDFAQRCWYSFPAEHLRPAVIICSPAISAANGWFISSQTVQPVKLLLWAICTLCKNAVYATTCKLATFLLHGALCDRHYQCFYPGLPHHKVSRAMPLATLNLIQMQSSTATARDPCHQDTIEVPITLQQLSILWR